MLEAGQIYLAHNARHDLVVGLEESCRRHAGQPQLVGDLPVGVEDAGMRQLELLVEPVHVLGHVLVVEPEQLDLAARLLELLQSGCFHPETGAPILPDVGHDRCASERSEIDRLAGDRVDACEWRCLFESFARDFNAPCAARLGP